MPQNNNSQGKRAGRVLLCSTGAFQAYMLPGFVLQLLRHFADDVQVVLTRAAAKLVSPYALEVASRHPVYIETDDRGPDVFVPHIELGRGVDLVLVYPATVNVLAKIASGIADDLVSTLILATQAPVIFLPSTNPGMLEHPAVQRNVRQLREDGYLVLDPLPGTEVATREGLDAMSAQFWIPTLLLQMRAAIGTSTSGRVRRTLT